MSTLEKAFGLPVGYSDHTQGIEVAIAAVSMGAKVIEKHFTLDRTMDGPDHIASTEPDEFLKMVNSIRNVELSMGNGVKQPTDTEVEISKVVLKRIVANKRIPAGKTIEESDLCVKRSSTGLPARAWDYVVGTIARKDYCIDEGITF